MTSRFWRIGEAIARPPAVDLLPPRLQRRLVDLRLLRLPDEDQILEHLADVADDRQVDADVLVDRRGIDVDVDLPRSRREGVDPAGDAVVEARPDADHHVAIVHGVVRLVGPVHAEHAEPLRVGRRIGAEAHQRRRDRIAGHAHELAQQLGRSPPRIDHAAAGVEDRPLGLGDQIDRGADGRRVALGARTVAYALDLLRADIGAGRELHVLGNVDEHRAGPAVRGDVERLVQDAGEIVDVLDQPVVLGRRPRDADGVAFLEGVVADEMGRHLPGEADDRDRVHQRVGQRRHHVGGARAGGDQRDADAAGRAGIAFGRMAGALLVTDEDMLDIVLLDDLVIDRQDRAAGIAEDVLDALVLQRPDDHFRAGHFDAVRLLFHRSPHRVRLHGPHSANKKGPLGALLSAPP